MKKIFNSLFVIIASMVAFSACVKEENSPASETKTVQFFAESIETKTAFGTPDGTTYPTLWTANDEKVCVALNDMDEKDSALEISQDFKTARFETQFADNGGTSYKFFALSPASAKNSMSSSVLSANIWNAQTPLANSVDERAQVLYAVSDAYSAFPASVNMVFKHFTAYGKLSFANVNLNGAKMTSVTIESSVNIAGRWNYNVNSGEYTENSGSSAITLNTTATENIWFACAPVDMDGQSLTFIINTDKGPLSKTVTLSGKKFEAGKIAKMVVDMSDAKFAEPVVFELVTDVNDLTVGSEIIIAASASNVAISTTQNGNNRAEAAITKSADKSNIVDPASGVQVITVKEGKTAGTFAFNVGNGYLYAASSSSNYLRTETNLSANSSWTVTIASTGVATIKATGSNTRNLLKYNSSSKLFSCYSSGQADVVIYKKRQQSGPETPEDYLTVSETEIDVNADATSASFTVSSNLEWTATSDDAEVTVDGSTVNVSFESNDSEEAKVYTVTVSAAGVESAIVKINQAGKIDVSDVPVGIKAIYSAIESEASATLDAFEVALTDAVVTYVNGNSAFVEDETAGILIYKSSHGLAAGDKLNGVLTGKGYVRYGVCQITEFDLTNITKVTGAEIPVHEITVAELLEDYNSYLSRRVKIVDATIIDGITGSADKNGAIRQNENSINLYNNTTVNFVETEVVDFYAYPSYYSTTKQLATWEAPVTKKVATPVITCVDNVVNITSGTSGASVYYAIGNGEFVAYLSAGVTIDATVTVKAYATKSGLETSEIANTECEYVDLSTQPSTVDVTLSFANKAQRTSYSTTQQVWSQNGIIFTNDKSASTTNVGDYAAPARFYANSKITVAAPGNITKIIFDCNSSSYATTLKTSIGTVSGASVTASSDKVTVTFTTTVESFVINKLTAQVRMDSIEVTYLN